MTKAKTLGAVHTHTHTSKLIEMKEDGNIFIYDENNNIGDRLLR